MGWSERLRFELYEFCRFLAAFQPNDSTQDRRSWPTSSSGPDYHSSKLTETEISASNRQIDHGIV